MTQRQQLQALSGAPANAPNASGGDHDPHSHMHSRNATSSTSSSNNNGASTISSSSTTATGESSSKTPGPPKDVWTPEDEATLKRMRSENHSWSTVAKALGRSTGACRVKYHRMNEEETVMGRNITTSASTVIDGDAKRGPGRPKKGTLEHSPSSHFAPASSGIIAAAPVPRPSAQPQAVVGFNRSALNPPVASSGTMAFVSPSAAPAPKSDSSKRMKISTDRDSAPKHSSSSASLGAVSTSGPTRVRLSGLQIIQAALSNGKSWTQTAGALRQLRGVLDQERSLLHALGQSPTYAVKELERLDFMLAWIEDEERQQSAG